MEKKTAIFRRSFARFFSVCLLVLQSTILDYYLIKDEASSRWFAWIITDAVVLSTWALLMWISSRKSQIVDRKDKDKMKIVYVAWVVYALHLVPKVITLFKVKASLFDDEKRALGPNTFKLNLSLTSLLFLFLIFSYHDAKLHSRRKYYLEKLTAAVALDLFDSVEMLEYLFSREKITISIENSILTFSCINIFLPTFALFELKFNKFHESGEVSFISFKFIYICSFTLFVNVPFMVLRLILWHDYHLDVSVLLAKNLLVIVMGVIEVFEFFVEERPKKCEICEKAYAIGHFKEHRGVCVLVQMPEIICEETRNATQEKRTNKQILNIHENNEHDDMLERRQAVFPAIARITTYV